MSILNSNLKSIFIACVLFFCATHSVAVIAETAAAVATKMQADIDAGDVPQWWTPKLPENIQCEVDNKSRYLTSLLQLNDQAMIQKTEMLLNEHYSRVWAWHQQVDEQLDEAWAAWDRARDNRDGKQKDELQALAIMVERVDPIDAEFVPQIQGFLQQLRQIIGEQKSTELLDHITRSPGATRTFNAYVSMIPEMTEAEKKILWERMVQAREDSLAAWTDGRIVKIFKKYKVRNEFSIDYFGYDYLQRYQAWVKAGAR